MIFHCFYAQRRCKKFQVKGGFKGQASRLCLCFIHGFHSSRSSRKFLPTLSSIIIILGACITWGRTKRRRGGNPAMCGRTQGVCGRTLVVCGRTPGACGRTCLGVSRAYLSPSSERPHLRGSIFGRHYRPPPCIYSYFYLFLEKKERSF